MSDLGMAMIRLGQQVAGKVCGLCDGLMFLGWHDVVGYEKTGENAQSQPEWKESNVEGVV